MPTWSDGYITELPYTRNFFPVLSPIHLRLTCVLAGVTPPPAEGFDYCELGCGQGLSTALLAAIYPESRFYGVDFNPTHIALAGKFADAAGISNVTFIDASFEEAADREDLPAFDYITLHGIYSWVSGSNRRHIVRLIRRCLKPGGVVYNSYNALPGRAALAPIRRIFKELVPPSDHPLEQVAAGLGLLEELARHPMGIFRQSGRFRESLDRLKQQPRRYLAHEFLNEHWNAFYCTDVFREMADAKLTYAGSARIGLNFEALSVPPPFLKQYQELATPERRQLFRDLLLNTAFRMDVYVRGPAPIATADRAAVDDTIRLGRRPFHPGFQKTYRCGAGEVNMEKDPDIPAVYDYLSRETATLADLAQGIHGIAPRKVMEAVRHLLTSRQICAYQKEASPAEGMDAVNRAVLEQAAHDRQGAWLCSQVLGNAVHFPFLEALILKARLEGTQVAQVPEKVADALAAQQMGITVNQHEIKERRDLVRHIRQMAAGMGDTVSELQRLGIFQGLL